MNSTNNKHVSEIAKNILELIHKNNTQWQNPWREGDIIPPPNNLTTGKNYSGVNKIHLKLVAQIKNHDDPRWMTYLQAQKSYEIQKNKTGKKEIHLIFESEAVQITGEDQSIEDERKKAMSRLFQQAKEEIEPIAMVEYLEGEVVIAAANTTVGNVYVDKDSYIDEHGEQYYVKYIVDRMNRIAGNRRRLE